MSELPIVAANKTGRRAVDKVDSARRSATREAQIDWLRRHLWRLEDFGLEVTETAEVQSPRRGGWSRYDQNEGKVEIERTALDRDAPDAAFADAQHAAYRIIGGYLLCGPEDEDTPGHQGHPRRKRTGNAAPCVAKPDADGQYRALQYVLRVFADRRMARSHGPNWEERNEEDSRREILRMHTPNEAGGEAAGGRSSLPWLANAEVEAEAARLARELEDALGDDLREGPGGPLERDPPTWQRWILRGEYIRTRREAAGLRCRRRSVISSTYSERVLSVSTAELTSWIKGQAIQRAMPELAAEEREFLLTGITPEEWGGEQDGGEQVDAMAGDDRTPNKERAP